MTELDRTDGLGRKDPPPIEGDDKHTDDTLPLNGSVRATPVVAPTPEPKSFHEHLTLTRLVFSQRLVAGCVLLIVILALIGHFFSGNSGNLDSAIEILKLIGTTSLGFVLARAIDDQ